MTRKKPNLLLPLALATGAGLLAFMFFRKKGVTSGTITITPEDKFNADISKVPPGTVLTNPDTGKKIIVTKELQISHAIKAQQGRG